MEAVCLNQDGEKEVDVPMSMKQEMDHSMKMMEKDICEKQDALLALRQQLEELRTLSQELSHKSQSSDGSVKPKGEILSRLDEKANQIAGTIKQLEQSEKDMVKQAKSLNNAAGKILQKQH
ncbi:hypothetical protein AGOR_G00008150 [Albula goreensis]|uniref:Uncharacterized protein n=1 Tax=Albula goreensis TaxID=1534307 RepID=A0A8T3E8V3_9TELE|nr:hypothetical protein AGOR_G00008150 [Albula goreensis]